MVAATTMTLTYSLPGVDVRLVDGIVSDASVRSPVAAETSGRQTILD